MVAELSNYLGREQAYIKHLFLSDYFEKLVFKTAGRFDCIVYVDGFSGPWQSSGEAFSDTSFGIALSALRKAKAAWKSHKRDVRMIAMLAESTRASFEQLAALPAKYPDIEVRPFHGDFIALAPQLLAGIPREAFAFIFVDPKGWRIPIERLGGLLGRPNTEVVFNFMFDFINRAASMSDPAIVDGLDQLIPFGNWRPRLAELSHGNAAQRKAILIDAFSETLRQIGSYKYVTETAILRPLKDRTLYSLIFGTRKSAGIEVFRDCQIEALRAQDHVRGAVKLTKVATVSGQSELFGSLTDMAPASVDAFLEKEAQQAREMFLSLCPTYPETAEYGAIWPSVLSQHTIRKTELSAIANELRKDGLVVFPTWGLRKRTPNDSYKLHRPAANA